MIEESRSGDVAQMGERLVRNEEVGGSIPLISTSQFLARSCAIVVYEPRQDRKVAAVSNRPMCRRGAWPLPRQSEPRTTWPVRPGSPPCGPGATGA